MIKKPLIIILGLSIVLPLITFAETINNLSELIQYTLTMINLLIPVIFGAAVLAFFWGIIKFISSGGDETARKEARHFIVYGIVGLFVMVSVWSLVAILKNTFFERSTSPANSGGGGGGQCVTSSQCGSGQQCVNGYCFE